jgi:hypothetical protein
MFELARFARLVLLVSDVVLRELENAPEIVRSLLNSLRTVLLSESIKNHDAGVFTYSENVTEYEVTVAKR